MKQYKTLKDLPGIPAGSIGHESNGKIVFTHEDAIITTLSAELAMMHKDFFEEVKEE